MSLDDLARALMLVRTHADEADFVGPRDEQLIVSAEARLGLTFPPTYRQFLLTVGAGDIAGEEFYGIISGDFDQSSVSDAIWLTLKRRSQSALPTTLLIVYAVGNGEFFALDTSQVNADRECPVVVWDPRKPTVPAQGYEVIAPDFGAFFLETIRDALADTES